MRYRQSKRAVNFFDLRRSPARSVNVKIKVKIATNIGESHVNDMPPYNNYCNLEDAGGSNEVQ